MYNQSTISTKPLQFKCFSEETISVLQDVVKNEDFSALKQLAKTIKTIETSCDQLHEMSNPKTANKYHFIQEKEAAIISLIIGVAAGILFGSLTSAVGVGLGLGVVSFFASIYFIKFTNNNFLERETTRFKQEIKMQEKRIQDSMYVPEQFCKKYGEDIQKNSDSYIRTYCLNKVGVMFAYSINEKRDQAEEKCRRAFQELETLCSHYAVK